MVTIVGAECGDIRDLNLLLVDTRVLGEQMIFLLSLAVALAMDDNSLLF